MNITIVTPSFNQGRFIEQTIRSVADQGLDNVEHIVMDGGSTDETVSILKRYPRLLWSSQKDGGQGSAINLGFRKAQGDILAWINSDDYYEQGALRAVSGYFEQHPECMVLYGRITYVDRDGNPLFTLRGDDLNYDNLVASPDLVRQPSTFWRREALEAVGMIDESFHLVMDFDLFLRMARRFRFHYIDVNLSYFRTYDENKTNTFRRRQVTELLRVFRKQGVPLRAVHVKMVIRKLAESTAGGRALLTARRNLINRLR